MKCKILADRIEKPRGLTVSGNMKDQQFSLTDFTNLVHEVNWALINGKWQENQLLTVMMYPSDIDLPRGEDRPPISMGAQTFTTQSLAGGSKAQTGKTQLLAYIDRGIHDFLLGHSENRLAGETDMDINTKLKDAIKVAKDKNVKLSITLCIGEELSVRESGNHLKYLKDQLQAALLGISVESLSSIDFVLAYEPVWAIGTGKNATPEQVQEVHAFIRQLLERELNSEFAKKTKILYGGSVKPENAKALFSNPDVDGGLVGGASWKPDSFIALIKVAIDLLPTPN